jgi:ferredoxin-NADP reductase
LKATLIEKIPQAGNVVSFRFKPEEPITWQAGEYLHWENPNISGEDKARRRWFTIDTPPYTGLIGMTTRITDSAFKQALNALELGDHLIASEKGGDFLWEDTDRPMIFVAGGIGVTPFHSMLAERSHGGQRLNVRLLYFNRDENIPYKEEFDGLLAKHEELKIDYIVGEPVTVDAIKNNAPYLEEALIYLSGPEPMVESVGEALKSEASIPDDQLKQDWFPGYTESTG